MDKLLVDYLLTPQKTKDGYISYNNFTRKDIMDNSIPMEQNNKSAILEYYLPPRDVQILKSLDKNILLMVDYEKLFKIKEEFTCIVCFDIIKDFRTNVSCNKFHFICLKCIDQIMNQAISSSKNTKDIVKARCPHCRVNYENNKRSTRRHETLNDISFYLYPNKKTIDRLNALFEIYENLEINENKLFNKIKNQQLKADINYDFEIVIDEEEIPFCYKISIVENYNEIIRLSCLLLRVRFEYVEFLNVFNKNANFTSNLTCLVKKYSLTEKVFDYYENNYYIEQEESLLSIMDYLKELYLFEEKESINLLCFIQKLSCFKRDNDNVLELDQSLNLKQNLNLIPWMRDENEVKLVVIAYKSNN